MKNRPPRPPAYLRHKSRDRAYCWIYENGKRRQIYLGPYGSAESHRRYREIASRHLLGHPLETGGASIESENTLTIAELVARFLAGAEKRYRRADGTPTGEFANFKDAVKPLLLLYRDELAEEFGPRKLRRTREAMQAAGLARTTINSRVRRVRQVMRWAVAHELIPARVHQALGTVEALRRGEARETPPVRPVDWDDVEPVLPRVGTHVKAMVLLLWFTGMRANEIVQMTTGSIDRGNEPWLYLPPSHKTEHHGKSREIPLGPQCRNILRPFLRANPDAPLFSPAEAMLERRESLRAKRSSRVTPSQAARDGRTAANPKQTFNPTYSVSGLGLAVRRACKKAGVVPWGLNRLRHAFATRVRRDRGLEVVQTILGHSHPDTSLIYAEADSAAARRVMEEIA